MLLADQLQVETVQRQRLIAGQAEAVPIAGAEVRADFEREAFQVVGVAVLASRGASGISWRGGHIGM